jgi:glycosyltransferase involved in cell wall biosynthesis
MKKISICIVSHNAYGAISGGESGFVGGVERQTSLLAKWLVGEGYKITMITWDEGGPREELIQGVRVIKVCRKDQGLPGLRFFHPKWTGLAAALKKANADLYYHNCGECVTGQVAMWCRANGKKFVFALASNADCDPSLPEMAGIHEKLLYRLGLKKADQIIVQTETQQLNLQKYWKLNSVVVPMPCKKPEDDAATKPPEGAPRILWVGRVCPVKRLEWFVKLADISPEWQFDLVGPFDGGAYATGVQDASQGMANLTLRGRVSKDAVGVYYQSASILCCTSRYEGFPNTFLEAWSRGIPVVSTFDPDGLIQRHGLGRYVTGLDEMRVAISELLHTPGECDKIGRRSVEYFSKNHTVEQVMPQMEHALLGAMGGGSHPLC